MPYLILLATLAAPTAHVVPWGLVDDKVAYLVRDGGIDAVDVATGKLLWKSDGRAHLLGISDGTLFAWVPSRTRPNAFRVVSRNAATGEPIKTSPPITLPDWVVVYDPPWGRSFSADGKVVGDALFIRWQARGWYASGARPTPEKEAAARKAAMGVVLLNLKKNTAEMLAADKMPAAPKPDLPADLIKAAARPERTPLGPVPRVRRAGEYVFAVDFHPGGTGEAHSLLRRWAVKDGKELPPIKLGHCVIARDDATVLSVTRKDDKATWTAVSPATGERIGQFETTGNTASVDAVGPRAFLVETRPGESLPTGRLHVLTLKVFDLKSGKLLWQRPVKSYLERNLPK